jgi:TetR/AcrR family transcriptional regulator, regulator of mycofactocin system
VSKSNPTPRGRPPSTSRGELERVALRLFLEEGFEQTTVDHIATELGVARRTVFRYFPSKNDIVWGDFDAVLSRLRTELDARDPDRPMMQTLREAVVASNAYPPALLPELRTRITLIMRVPALQAHSMLRYAAWRRVVAEFAAAVTGGRPDDLGPRALGYAALAASTAAFGYWADYPASDLPRLLDESYRMLEAGFESTRARGDG